MRCMNDRKLPARTQKVQPKPKVNIKFLNIAETQKFSSVVS